MRAAVVKIGAADKRPSEGPRAVAQIDPDGGDNSLVASAISATRELVEQASLLQHLLDVGRACGLQVARHSLARIVHLVEERLDGLLRMRQPGCGLDDDLVEMRWMR